MIFELAHPRKLFVAVEALERRNARVFRQMFEQVNASFEKAAAISALE